MMKLLVHTLHPLCNRGLKCETILKMQHLSAYLIHIHTSTIKRNHTCNARMHPETLDFKGPVMSLDVLWHYLDRCEN